MRIFNIGGFDKDGNPVGWGFSGESDDDIAIDIDENGRINMSGNIPYTDLVDIARTKIIPEKYKYNPTIK